MGSLMSDSLRPAIDDSALPTLDTDLSMDLEPDPSHTGVDDQLGPISPLTIGSTLTGDIPAGARSDQMDIEDGRTSTPGDGSSIASSKRSSQGPPGKSHRSSCFR